MNPAEMLDTSTPLTSEFFVNPRCPLGVVPGVADAAPKANISEEVKCSSAVRTKAGDNPNSLSKVAGEMEEPIASGES